MHLWSFLLGGTVFVGLFLAVATLAAPGARGARVALFLLLSSLSVFLLEFVLLQTGYYGPPYVFLTYPLAFVMGPAFYLLARQLVAGDQGLRPRDALHALPVIVMAVNQFPYTVDALRAGTAHGIAVRRYVALGGCEMMALHLAQLGVYAFLGTRLLRRRARQQGDADSGEIVHRARWLAGVAAAFAAMIAVQFLGAVVMTVTGVYVDQSEYGMALAIGAAILPIGWTMSRHARLLSPPDAPGEKYRKSGLDQDRLRAYRTQLLEYVARVQPYLDPDLRLDSLAHATGIPAHHLSQTLNQAMGTTFVDFVHRQRVRHAASLLLQPGDPPPTILAVAFDSGFASKASFNRVFKAHTGMTPSAFRAEAKGDGNQVSSDRLRRLQGDATPW